MLVVSLLACWLQWFHLAIFNISIGGPLSTGLLGVMGDLKIPLPPNLIGVQRAGGGGGGEILERDLLLSELKIKKIFVNQLVVEGGSDAGHLHTTPSHTHISFNPLLTKGMCAIIIVV